MRAGVGPRERAGGRAGAALRALHAAGCSPHVRCARLPSPRSTCGTRPSLLLRPRAAAEGPATRFPRGCGGERPCPRADSPGLRSCPSLQGSCWAHGVLLPLSIITTPGLQGERGRGGGNPGREPGYLWSGQTSGEDLEEDERPGVPPQDQAPRRDSACPQLLCQALLLVTYVWVMG